MDLFTLSAKLTLDTSEYEKGLKGAEKTGSKSGSSIGNAFTKIGNVAKKGLQVAATAITAAGTAIVGLTTSSVKAYAQYEQLVGGVETLFGTGGKTLAEYQKTVGVTTESTRKQVEQSVKDYQSLQKAQSDVMENAKEAYRTAGLDMNSYMETVTGFSASLIQSLGGDTVKAAEYANRAIIDMSDNANKMGTNIESIQNAYQGFAKQNYTMLDNLKLGYGGTKTEMQRLIEDASKMTDVQERLGITVDKSSLSFGNIVNAISVMQEHLGIAGTTSKEAATTIQGSIGMMKAAWENLKISIADPEGNVPEALDTFVQSAGTAAKNLIPVVGNALKGIGTVIKDLAPIIREEIPKLTSEILPDLISGAVALLSGITKALIENHYVIIDGFGQILEGIGSEFQKSDNPVLKGAGKLVSLIGDLFRSGSIEEAWDKLWTGVKDLGAQLWEEIKSNMTKVWESIKAKATELWEGIKTAVTDAIESAKTTLGTLWEGIKTVATMAWENIKSTATSIWNAISSAVTTAIETASVGLGTLWEGIKSVATTVWDTISSGATTIWNAISSAITTAIDAASSVLATLWEGIKSVAVSVWDTISSVATAIWNAISSAITTAIDTASTVLSTLWDGIQSAAETVWNAISSTATSVWDGIKSAITSAVEAVRSTLESIWNFIRSTAETVWNSISATATSVWNGIKNAITTAIEAVRSTLETIWNAIKSAAETVWNAISTTATTIWEAIKSAISAPIEAVKTTLATIWESIRSTAETVWNAVSGAIQTAVGPIISVIQGVIDTVSSVIDWFNKLMGFDGQNLASTTSSHTHETIYKVSGNVAQSIVEDTTGTELPKDTGTVLGDWAEQASGGIAGIFQKGIDALFGRAIGDPYIPYDNFPALLHRGEVVLTATQARKYREGGDFDLSSLGQIIQQAIVTGMENANVNAYMDADLVTDAVNRRIGSELVSRRYSP